MAKSIWSWRVDEKNSTHWHITVFNRGGNAGRLCVEATDAEDLLVRLACIPFSFCREWMREADDE